MEPHWANGLSTLYHADAREIPLPDGSVHCADDQSHAYFWNLRSIMVLGESTQAWRSRLEPTLERAHRQHCGRVPRVAARANVTTVPFSSIMEMLIPEARAGVVLVQGRNRQVNAARVQRPYNARDFLPTKNLMGLPWRVAHRPPGRWVGFTVGYPCGQKNNPMPESVTDRPTSCL